MNITIPNKPAFLVGEMDGENGERLRVSIVIKRFGEDAPAMQTWIAEQMEFEQAESIAAGIIRKCGINAPPNIQRPGAPPAQGSEKIP